MKEQFKIVYKLIYEKDQFHILIFHYKNNNQFYMNYTSLAPWESFDTIRIKNAFNETHNRIFPFSSDYAVLYKTEVLSELWDYIQQSIMVDKL